MIAIAVYNTQVVDTSFNDINARASVCCVWYTQSIALVLYGIQIIATTRYDAL